MAGRTLNELIERGAAAAEAEPPRLFNVIFFNDDKTEMGFVIKILEDVYGHGRRQAERLTLQVHEDGSAVVGTYPFDIADAKVCQTISLARSAGYPLRCDSQPEERPADA